MTSREKASLRSAEVRAAISAERARLEQLPRTERRAACADLVRTATGDVAAMRVMYALGFLDWRSIPATRIMRHVGVDARTRLRDLTDRQREQLATAIGLPYAEQIRLPLPEAQLGHDLAVLRARHSRAVRALRSRWSAEQRVRFALAELEDRS